MFHVRWAKSVEDDDRYVTAMVIPQSTKLTNQNEPWVFGKDVNQSLF
jgi:hypothetical protein